MLKAVFFDIDGTLLPFGSKELPQSTKCALDALKEKGIKLFVATGRPYDIMTFIMDIYDFDGYLTFNGQYCFDKDGNDIYENQMSKESTISMLNYINGNKISAILATKKKSYRNTYCDDPYFADHEVIEDMNILKNMNILQVMAYIPKEQDEEFVSHYPGSKAVRWSPTFADVIPASGGKDHGIDEILKYYSISLEETMAFGDGGNDISMLEHCHIGVAMGNADEKVKSHADYVTTDVDKDGIYNALKHFHII
ncbi:MAG: Cof-type HAD-IIB family hydrolase [Holdemanella sp.]|nr:Cof-type HAD-IIB family hydrolase [Holdemanella sp.]